MRSRRCSGLSTRNRPPNDQNAWPPSEASGSWSTQDHPPAGVGQLGGGDQAGQAGADDDDVGVQVRHQGARRCIQTRTFGSRPTRGSVS